ncbi:MAG TPA: glucosamine-6-phosphate deaminase [Vicinamibacterales bacterium]|nr:glucosamine-6-phosphate deaminase [Vicinamibacterales bacterium]
MIVKTYTDRDTMSLAAAAHAARTLRETIDRHATVRLIAATGASQIPFLDALVREPDVDWTRVELFHLDEYVGLPIEHPASFRKYLLERLIRKAGITRYHLLDGGHPERAIEEVGREIAVRPIDLAFVGIGENGHLAFNDPPADFAVDDPYLIVALDDACRRQQVGEGWFASVEEVPARAISMSVRQILLSKEILCVVPDARKAVAVKACLEGPITPMAPASVLRSHPQTTVYLDRDSARLLSPATRGPTAAETAS